MSQNITCKHCGIEFVISNEDREMMDKIAPVISDKKYDLPNPTFCPDCRLQRRLSFRNDKKIYRRKCDFSGKDMISIFTPESDMKVYDHHIWHSDVWSPLDYGRDFDFTKSFFDQFSELYKSVPESSIINEHPENSDYCHHCANMKDSYLVFGSANCENCYYGYRVVDCQNVYDSSFVNKSNVLYQCIDVENSNFLRYAQNCKDCSFGWYLYNCSNCQNCLCCVNLHNASYCIENKQYTKEEYTELFPIKLKEMNQKKFTEFRLQFPHRDVVIVGSEKVIGDVVYNSKNIYQGFGVRDSENIRYGYDLYNKMSNCMDCFSGYGPVDRAYETVSTGINGYNNYFTYYCYPAQDAYYSFGCFGSSHVFGCVGLSNKKYCILNKQYTEDEYFPMVQKIVEYMQTTKERGEFFPSSMSPFGYNETVAIEYFPLSKEDTIKKGFNRSNYETPFPQVDKIINANELPSIAEVSDEILNQAIVCEISGRPFRIIKSELDFYRKYNISLPTKHPDQRHLERIQTRNPKKLRERTCTKCGKDIKTTYSPDRPEKIYCEECYQKEIYG